MAHRRPMVTVLAVALAIAVAPPAWAASPPASAASSPASAASPREVLETFFGRANATLRSADPERGIEGPRQAIRALVNEMFDYRDAAARALGPAWRSRTPAQQTEFVRLFAELVERSYIAFVGSKVNVADGLNISYVEESVTGDRAAVATTLRARNGADLDVDYIMGRRGARWMVRDVIVDGMSLVANYRSQFTRILATSSYAELVVRMQGDALDVPPPVLVAAAPPPVAPRVAQPAPAPVQPARPVPTPAVIPHAVSAPPAPAPTSVAPAPVAPTPVAPTPVAPTPVAPTPVAPTPVAKDLHVAARPRDEAASKVEAIRMSVPEAIAPESRAAERVTPTDAGHAGAIRYWIQVGAFKTVGAAAQLVEQLRRQGMTASNDKLTSVPWHPAGALARVRVGPFATHSDAQSKLRELTTRGYAPFIAAARD